MTPTTSSPSGQRPLLRRGGPPGVRPSPLHYHHLHSDWTDALSQEAARPIEGLQVAHRGHRGVSRFIQPVAAVGLLGGNGGPGGL